MNRQDLHVLESALSEWVLWHQKTYQQGYTPGCQLYGGSIGLDVDQLQQLGVVSWIDKLAAVAGTGTRACHGAVSYEQDEAPPLYDRGVSELLAPAAAPTSGISMLPGGAEAARRRAAAEACYGTECKDLAAATQAAAKRRKLSDNRCFNCGSYAHGLADCSKPFDQERVAAARAEQAANRRPSNGFMANLMRQRYFNAAFDEKANGVDSMTPGCISAELAEALGLSSTLAPPPWLGRMAVLGVPSRYCRADDADQGVADGRIAFVDASEDAESEDVDVQPQEQNGAGNGGKSEASASTQEQQDDPADADFVPLGAAAAQQHEAGAANGERNVQQSIPQPGKPAVKQRQYTKQFPGVNAPLPEGADAAAWQAELEKASYLSGMLGLARC
eukprot:GHUV01021039.1.p1 GENE.GHUV01021039.1~~GHUV01021039.1.p1  ORF type:complete len:389 (+),score=137.30 GHUV01021039.1:824-1990(+)